MQSGAHRLVTITGPGGVGKTRLATEVLLREASAFPGGAVFVDLSAVREPGLVLPRVTTALGLPELVADPVRALVSHLQGLRVIVVLDNLEQLTGAAPVLADLVARCPDLVVLATSRAPLRVRAERELVLSPLATPSQDDVETVTASPAVALLLDRAAASGSPLDVTERDAPALAAICRRLDGIPLALELAAPGMRLLSPSTLLSRLEETGAGAGLRDLPERHRSMAAVSTGAWTSSSRRRWPSSPGSPSSAEGSRSTPSRPSRRTSTSCPPWPRSSTSHSFSGCRPPTTSLASGS